MRKSENWRVEQWIAPTEEIVIVAGPDNLPREIARGIDGLDRARLMAAAPDLLKACKALKAWQDSDPDAPPGDGFESLTTCIGLAEAAIREATGEDT